MIFSLLLMQSLTSIDTLKLEIKQPTGGLNAQGTVNLGVVAVGGSSNVGGPQTVNSGAQPQNPNPNPNPNPDTPDTPIDDKKNPTDPTEMAKTTLMAKATVMAMKIVIK